MSNWNWACEQLLQGNKVTSEKIEGSCICVEGSQIVEVEEDGSKSIYVVDRRDLVAKDWHLYQEPEKKKWTQEDIRKANAGIELGFKWATRDADDYCVFLWVNKPSKLVEDGIWGEHTGYEASISVDSLPSIQWEDTQPTRLQDIVDGEVEDEED